MELEVAMTYAAGLYQAAEENNVVEEVKEELIQVDKILRENKEFGEILMNPALHKGAKKEMIRNVFQGRVHHELENFMYVLVDKGRTYGFHNMTRQYLELVDKVNGVGEGVIYSTYPLTKRQLSKFEEDTEKLLRKKICLENKVNTDLIGGVKIFVDGKIIDISLRNKLETMSNKLKEY